ncbi:polysaccharide biosynthesis tyrosine autokinase [Novosphingobium sp. BW1]|uniref:GumC family protein n=1 Tax=Novosphingobium sp. BW1 TaxID=2592621 RepID=UPI0011DEDB39|nr:polysaccharide biosynthesis tyrosine autokinase [Novosphingobium sp. BW1]TYC85096.1 polysaccharide biosynthesis tyrosine autokinase [Novosphingobium sp. BW1]
MKDINSYPTQEIGSDPEQPEFDLHGLLKLAIALVRANILLIAGVVLGVVALGVIITLLITPKYEAASQILIEDQADQIIEGGELQQAITSKDTERFLQTQLGIIQGRSLARTIVQDGKLGSDASFFTAFGDEMPTEPKAPGESLEDARREKAVDLLLEGLSVSIPVDSRIATIKVVSRNAALSAELANKYAERFSAYNLNQKYDSSSYARKFLANQLQETRTKLTESERELNQYARAAGLIRVNSDGSDGSSRESVLSVTNGKLVQLNAAAAAATAERIAAEDRWKTLANKSAMSISEVNSNSAITQLVAAKAVAESELAEELAQHKDGYSTVKAKRREVAELNRRIGEIGEMIKGSARTEYEATAEKERSLLDQVGSLQDEALNEQDRGVQYSVLKRVADTNRALYESLLSRYNQLNASAGASSNNVTIVDRAITPHKPSSPNLPLNVALSFVLGLLAAAGVVALKELLDDAVRSPEDVERKLGMRLLGLVPNADDEQIADGGKGRRSDVNEAYRSLVTNLSYSTADGLPKVLVVTSSREGEGKSMTARAIATDIAQLGKRAIIVDADLRRPTLHRAFGKGGKFGLTDYLTGQKTFDEIVLKSPVHDNLDFLTAMPMAPEPSFLLAGERLQKVVEEARARYDVVVLDCPPLLGLSDVPLIAQNADGVLFVIDGSSFHRGAIKAAIRRLDLINVRVLGAVLNRFSPKLGSEDYSYNYYSYGSE